MKNISLDIKKAACFLEEGAVAAFEPQVKAALEALEKSEGDEECTAQDRITRDQCHRGECDEYV